MSALKKKQVGVYEYPAAAFAHVGDLNDTNTWELCLWDRTGLSEIRCLEALDLLKDAPIPRTALGSAKAKILNGLRRKGVHIDEALGMNVTFKTMMEIREAGLSEDGRKYTAHVVILEPGFNKQSGDKARYYPREVIARDYKIFEGAKVFANHIGRDEERNRPEGDIMAWVGNLQNVTINKSTGAAEGDIVVHDQTMREKLANLKEVNLLSQMGVSVHAIGTAMRKVVEGVSTFVVESFQKVRSVDFVTEPGAGGRVLLYESLVEGENNTQQKEKSMKKGIREAEGDPMVGDPMVGDPPIEPTVEELKAQLAALQAENADLKAQLEALKPAAAPPPEAPVQEAIREVKKLRVEIDRDKFQLAMREALADADLPKASQKRILEAHRETTDVTTIPAIITAEIRYVKDLREAGVIRGCGSGKPRDAAPEIDEVSILEARTQDYVDRGYDLGTARQMAKGYCRV